MGITSENVAERYGITRAELDAFAADSHAKASRAQVEGKFTEIVPMSTRWVNPKDLSDVAMRVIKEDDGIRHNASPESMARLKPAFKADGTSTAGNSSQVSDGAAAALMMRRDMAEKLGYEVLGRFVATRVAGCAPDEMGVGPAVAVPKLLEATGVEVEEVDVWELNEGRCFLRSPLEALLVVC